MRVSKRSLINQTEVTEVAVEEVEEEEVIEAIGVIEVEEEEDLKQLQDRNKPAAKKLEPEVADHRAQESTPTRKLPLNEQSWG